MCQEIARLKITVTEEWGGGGVLVYFFRFRQQKHVVRFKKHIMVWLKIHMAEPNSGLQVESPEFVSPIHQHSCPLNRLFTLYITGVAALQTNVDQSILFFSFVVPNRSTEPLVSNAKSRFALACLVGCW